VTSNEILTRATTAPDHVIAYGDDPNQFGHLWLPSANGAQTPVVMLIHGGFWRSAHGLEHMSHMAADLCAHGLAVWSVEYRRLGQPGGGFPGTGDDIHAAFSHLRVMSALYPFDPTDVAVVGFSAGGHLAAWLASVVPVCGAVSLAGVVDLHRGYELGLSDGVVSELMGGSPAERPHAYASFDPTVRVPVRTSVRLFHGTEDASVPLEISQRFKAAAGDNATLTVLPGAGHFELIDPHSLEYQLIRTSILSLVGR
jgi:acetyl esterase/lipase